MTLTMTKGGPTHDALTGLHRGGAGSDEWNEALRFL